MSKLAHPSDMLDHAIELEIEALQRHGMGHAARIRLNSLWAELNYRRRLRRQREEDSARRQNDAAARRRRDEEDEELQRRRRRADEEDRNQMNVMNSVDFGFKLDAGLDPTPDPTPEPDFGGGGGFDGSGGGSDW